MKNYELMYIIPSQSSDEEKEALIALGKDPKKSGISDAINARTSTRMAYGFKWFFKDEWEAMGGKLPK